MISLIRRIPVLKRLLLQLYDFYHKVTPLVVGAIVRNPAYLFNLFRTTVVAKPGTLSFQGGAFNPGALLLDSNDILLLARAQDLPWYKARGKFREFYLKGSPVIFWLNQKTLQTKKKEVINRLHNFPDNDDYATEDYRMFYWQEKKIINHSWIVKGIENGFIGQKSVKSALSMLDENEMSMRFLGFPKVDFPVQNFEKNWVYTTKNNKLLLFYSVNPFRVLELENDEELRFKTILNETLSGTINDPGDFGSLVSFSSNPVEYDEKHWFTVIHQFKKKITGRFYSHWALLIDKTTLHPVKISSEPIFTGDGARGRVPGYRYISSVLKLEDEILFFAGEGDIFVTVARKKITHIEKLLVDI